MRRTTNGAETRLVNKMSDPCYVYYKTGAIVLRTLYSLFIDLVIPHTDAVIDISSRDGVSRVFHQSHVPAAVDGRESRISPRYAQIEQFPGVLGEITAAVPGRRVVVRRMQGCPHAWDKVVLPGTVPRGEKVGGVWGGEGGFLKTLYRHTQRCS